MPFWYLSFRKVREVMHSRTISWLSLFAAFSFVVMMFNLPLPGGTTGHAVGVAIAAIVLGPWAAIVAVSLALLVQALFFGDGGITTFGANCFNMAVIGSLVAYLVYRCVAWKAAVESKRRVFAAGVAGYVAINSAAICAAIEFGIQPMLFHDASGTPLYAPYPLHIALPAMMIGHLTIAGAAEALTAAGLVRYLQRSDPSLLQEQSGGISATGHKKTSWRPLWVGLALLLVLSPLGIIAVGSAWGEWSAADFEDSTARRAIAATSQNATLPADAPTGLKRWSEVWGAPIADYAPAFITNRSAGYIFSAAAGTALIVAVALLFGQIWRRQRRGVMARALDGMLDFADRVLGAEQSWQQPGLLQRLDARVKLIGFLILLVATTMSASLLVTSLLFATALFLALLSRIRLSPTFTALWLGVLLFSGVVAVPAIFLTPGEILASFSTLHLNATVQGVRTATFLVLRAETASSLGVLLVLTTPWSRLLHALRSLGVPTVAVASAGMTYRYAFLFVQSAHNAMEAKQSRTLGRIAPKEQRRLVTAGMGALVDSVVHLSEEVHLAMTARGFRGRVRTLDEPAMRATEWGQIAGILVFSVALLWLGRIV